MFKIDASLRGKKNKTIEGIKIEKNLNRKEKKRREGEGGVSTREEE